MSKEGGDRRPTRSEAQPSGPRLAVALCAAQTALFAAAFAHFGDEEPGLSALVRFSARAAFALFLPVYCASSLRRLRPRPATRWLLRNRRYLGLSFAWAMALHLLSIGLLALLLGDAFDPDPVVALLGGLAYAFTAALALTSSDRAVRRLGPRRWGRLHRAGIHWLWLVFALFWTALALEEPGYWAMAALAWAAGALRFAAWRPGRSGSAAPPRAPEPELGDAPGPIR